MLYLSQRYIYTYFDFENRALVTATNTLNSVCSISSNFHFIYSGSNAKGRGRERSFGETEERTTRKRTKGIGSKEISGRGPSKMWVIFNEKLNKEQKES